MMRIKQVVEQSPSLTQTFIKAQKLIRFRLNMKRTKLLRSKLATFKEIFLPSPGAPRKGAITINFDTFALILKDTILEA